MHIFAVLIERFQLIRDWQNNNAGALFLHKSQSIFSPIEQTHTSLAVAAAAPTTVAECVTSLNAARKAKNGREVMKLMKHLM